jgi:hypothetical protein
MAILTIAAHVLSITTLRLDLRSSSIKLTLGNNLGIIPLDHVATLGFIFVSTALLLSVLLINPATGKNALI